MPSEDHAVLVFGGTPSSIRSLCAWKQSAEALNATAYLLERPGFGSTPPESRSFIRWRSYIDEFVSSHDFKAFSIIGISGGGPHALCCASHDLCKKIVLVSSSGRYPAFIDAVSLSSSTREMFSIARSGDSAKLVCWLEAAIRVDDFDSSVFTFGMRPTADELILLAQDWDFDLSTVKCDVCSFHSKSDTVAPFDVVSDYRQNIARFELIEEEGGHVFFRNERARSRIIEEAMKIR